jgi:hypothetical protein
MEVKVDKDELQEDIYHWVGFMLTSARALYQEPADYRGIRLLDSTERLISILENHGLADDFMTHVREELKLEKEGSVNESHRKELIDKLILEYTNALIDGMKSEA